MIRFFNNMVLLSSGLGKKHCLSPPIEELSPGRILCLRHDGSFCMSPTQCPPKESLNKPDDGRFPETAMRHQHGRRCRISNTESW
ncbi:hypothetical protein BHE74_00036406 [Ensete ventricosum]|nr:hypothetical protein GW17_00048624 [Ensete ventricosum]RWW56851.1 hypothetical protein BHE74_00036406 [Ensete ventricosum]RZR93280.1 hypothetical protein BHM03_00021749 [Ensete ventricosum]